MADVIQNMLQQALGDVARSTKFEAYINFNTPTLGPTNTEVYMHVKTSNFPGKTHEPYDLKFKGRSIPIRGQVKYENTWVCTFYLTEGHELKIAFEDWLESLDQTQNMSNNLSQSVKAGQSQGMNFASEVSIAQMDFSGEGQTAVYTLHNVFPKGISSVAVDYSAVGTTLEFTVEFSYSHYSSVRVGGLKLPAKTGAGAEIPGFSELANSKSQNFSQGGSGSNLRSEVVENINQRINNPRELNSQNRNIATNFAGAGNVVGVFDDAKDAAMAKNEAKSAKSAISGAVNHLSSRAISQVRRADSVVPSQITTVLSGEVKNISSNLTKKLTGFF